MSERVLSAAERTALAWRTAAVEWQERALAAEAEAAALRKALIGVAWKDSAGLCWCPGETEFAIAHPNADHTPRCIAARAALEQGAGGG